MAIWYCHWLQLRWRALFMIGVLLLFSIDGWDRLGSDRDPSVALIKHVWNVFWMAPFALAMGTTVSLRCVNRPDYFSGSLPVARHRWIWTRFAINGTVLFLIACAAFAGMGAWLTRQQYEVSWPMVLFSSAVGYLGMLPWLAASELLNSGMESGTGYAIAGAVSFLPYMVFTIWLLRLSQSAVADPQLVTNVAIFAVVGSAVMLSLATWAARSREL